MAKVFRRACSHPGCPDYGPGARCAAHARAHEAEAARVERNYQATRPSAPARGYGASWGQARSAFRSAFPVCQACGGRPTAEVHHRIPLSRGGSHDFANLIALCAPCHHAAHAASRWGARPAAQTGLEVTVVPPRGEFRPECPRGGGAKSTSVPELTPRPAQIRTHATNHVDRRGVSPRLGRR